MIILQFISNVITDTFYITASLNEEDKELNITIEVLKFENPNHLPLGENVTLICKTKWMSSVIVWAFNDKNVSENDG